VPVGVMPWQGVDEGAHIRRRRRSSIAAWTVREQQQQ
jgi:hypothetical protein